MQLITNETPVKTKRPYVRKSQKDAELRAKLTAEIREELYQSHQADLDALHELQAEQIRVLTAGFDKTLEDTKKSIWEQVEADRQTNDVLTRSELQCLREQLKTLEEASDAMQDEYEARIVQINSTRVDEQKLRTEIEAKLLDEWQWTEPLTVAVQTDLEKFTEMVKNQEGFKVSSDNDRQYVRVGSAFSYSMWTFDKAGKFICQNQFEFSE